MILSDEEINKRIHEIMGLCEHEWDEWHGDYDTPTSSARCEKCAIEFTEARSTKFTEDWDAFGLMWEFMQKHERKDKFRNYMWNKEIGHGDWADDLTDAYAWPSSLISPRSLAIALCEFFKEDK